MRKRRLLLAMWLMAVILAPGPRAWAEDEENKGLTLYSGELGKAYLHGSLIGYYQGANGADIGGERIAGIIDPGFVANLEMGWDTAWNGKLTVRLHTGQGDGADEHLVEEHGALLADLNTMNDDNPREAWIRVLDFYYTQQLLDDRLSVSVGKTKALVFMDQNQYANDENVQFVGKPFVNDPALDAESDYGPIAAVTVKPSDLFELTALVSSTSRPFASERKNTFDSPYDGPLVGFQAAVHPKLLDRDGTYRLYGWTATYNRPELARSEDDESGRAPGWGIGVSADQEVTDVVGLFARAGYHNEEVYAAPWSWAVGASFKGLVPDRNEDVLGVGVAGLLANGGRIENGHVLGDGTECHLEAYYRLAVTKYLFVTPDAQYVISPLGSSANDNVFAGMLRVELSM